MNELNFGRTHKRRKLRAHIKAGLIGFGIVLSVFLIVSGVQGINQAINGIHETINSLDERQTNLENSIEELNTELEEQKAISEKIATLLENQNNINNYDSSKPSYYNRTSLSDRSSGLESRELVPPVVTETMEITKLSLSNRLATIETVQNEQIQEEQKRLNDFSSFYAKATGNTDLCGYVNISEEEFNKWIAKNAPKGSPFIGRADVFLEASEITGLDPRYILAHASIESGWGTSRLARTKGNYFGIGAFDSNPSAAYNMGNGMREGIINGAKWIKAKYYDKGRTTLNKMKAAGYASDPEWVNKIVSNMN